MQTGNLIIVLVITGKAQDQPTETLQVAELSRAGPGKPPKPPTGLHPLAQRDRP